MGSSMSKTSRSRCCSRGTSTMSGHPCRTWLWLGRARCHCVGKCRASPASASTPGSDSDANADALNAASPGYSTTAVRPALGTQSHQLQRVAHPGPSMTCYKKIPKMRGSLEPIRLTAKSVYLRTVQHGWSKRVSFYRKIHFSMSDYYIDSHVRRATA